MKFLKRVYEYLKKAKIEWIIIVAAIFVDLLTKGIIESTMEEGETIVIIPNFLEFLFVYNDKAAFSFDFGLSSIVGEEGVVTVFIIITVIATLAFCYFLYRFRDKHLLGRIALALIIGGAIGNLYDRIFIGRVRDFIQIVYFGLDIELLGGRSFAIFNIADACLTVGVIALIVFLIFFDKYEEKNSEKQNENKENMSENIENNNVSQRSESAVNSYGDAIEADCESKPEGE